MQELTLNNTQRAITINETADGGATLIIEVVAHIVANCWFEKYDEAVKAGMLIMAADGETIISELN